MFPEHNPDEWASGNRKTASRDISIEKHVSRDLNALAPEVEEFITRLSMSLDTVGGDLKRSSQHAGFRL